LTAATISSSTTTTSSSTTAPRQRQAEPGPTEPMTHRAALEALSGLLVAVFVAMLSSTVVTTALPRIVADLDGTQNGYTWVMVATLLTLTVTTPVWGKLADQFSKKALVQVALLVFVAGSVLAGLAPTMEVLIGARAVQGVGVGGLTALVHVVIASIVAPRQRGRYFGYLGAVFAAATVSGPLLGGLIVDTPWLGWRWTFYVGVPFAALAFVVLQKTLRLPTVRRKVRIDYLGAALMASGISLLLVWVSVVGSGVAWASIATVAMVGSGVVLLALFLLVETGAAEPVVPLRLFRDRTTSLAVVASAMVGVSMFGATVFLSQYFQVGRGMSPTAAGLMSLPMVGGLLLSSILTGRVIAATGRWKRYLVAGAALIVGGVGLLGRVDGSVDLLFVGAAMTVLGLGVGAVNQNLVLAVQNNAAHADVGAASSLVAFFRMVGGSAGVAVLGAALSHQVAGGVSSGLRRIGTAPAPGESASSVPDLAAVPDPVREVFQTAFAEATGHTFWIAVPFVVVALVCIAAIREVPLRTTIERADEVVPPTGGTERREAESSEP
jgi:EmrB/QacA subfamily drug resistance transporter